VRLSIPIEVTLLRVLLCYSAIIVLEFQYFAHPSFFSSSFPNVPRETSYFVKARFRMSDEDLRMRMSPVEAERSSELIFRGRKPYRQLRVYEGARIAATQPAKYTQHSAVATNRAKKFFGYRESVSILGVESIQK